MTRPRITLVVARAANGVIGKDGKLPWHLPEDLKRFKKITMDAPMIMGRRTFESLPGLLPGRRHIVMTRDPDWHADGADVAHSVEEALSLVRADRVSVIGGAEIFALFMPIADAIDLTQVHADVEGDTVMPDPRGPDWLAHLTFDWTAKDGRPAYSHISLSRR